jgi:exodeoxyribonuclease VII large subunit
LAHITLRTPEQRVADGRLRLDDVSDRLYRFTEVRLTHERSRLVHLGGRLDAMSPLRVLERGYAVVQVESGAVTAAAALKMDDQVRLRFHDGERQARITDEA